MFVIDVIPLSRTAPAGVLSYRSRRELAPGSIVNVMLRRTATQGIVVECVPVAEAKAMLKGASFMLRGSEPALAGSLPESIMQAAQRVATYHAATLGSVLSALFAEHAKSDLSLDFSGMEASGPGFTLERSEQPIPDRAESYRSRIEGDRAEGLATLLVVPTIAELEFWKSTFKDYKPLVLSGASTGARRKEMLARAQSATSLIIATPSFSWTPIASLGSIIIDRVSAGSYTLPKRPYIDVVRALRALAESRALPLALGDYPLPLEYREDPSAAPLVGLATPVTLVDARRPEGEQEADQKGPWQAVPPEVLDAIRKATEQGGRVAVFTSRTGYAPAVVCRDCGQAVVDERGIPLSFATAGGARVLRSSDGKTILDATKDEALACARCGSWNLLPLGIGQERVAEELHAHLPNAFIVSLPSEGLRTRAAALKALSGTLRPGTILVGTEALLPWLLTDLQDQGPFSLAVIASADSLLALPFWRSRERFVRFSYFAAGLAKELIVVTRRPEDTAVEAVKDSGQGRFFSEEVGLRKALGYPPFGTLIVLHLEASARGIDELQAQVMERIGSYPYAILPDRLLAGRARRTIVLTLPEVSWPDHDLSSRLQALPPSVRIHIDPESLW